MDFKNLFNKKDEQDVQQLQVKTNTSTTIHKEGETYQQWGTQWAGQTGAAPLALSASLSVVVSQLKKEQENNRDIQEKNKKELQAVIDKLKASRDMEKNNLDAENKKLENCRSEIVDKKNRLEEIKKGKESGGNRMAKINLWIGGIITFLITIYLFVFYSSASYSAFFKQIDVNVSTTEACFDGKAWAYALHDGMTDFLFVTLLPVLFMGLGYVIYQYGQKQGREKYIKAAVLYGITFIFDTLLAFQISKKIYIALGQTKLADQPPYTVSLAFQNGDFWIIIFCGFIAYVIWGLVFGFAMNAYEQIDTRWVVSKRLDDEIIKLGQQEQLLNSQVLDIKNKIISIENKINENELNLPKMVVYNYNDIKQELNNFFIGWVGYMSLFAKPKDEFDKAENIFNGFIRTINNNLSVVDDKSISGVVQSKMITSVPIQQNNDNRLNKQ